MITIGSRIWIWIGIARARVLDLSAAIPRGLHADSTEEFHDSSSLFRLVCLRKRSRFRLALIRSADGLPNSV
jgi:hypothetical protein